MAVIGNSATQQAFTPAVDYFSGNGSTTAFTLSRPVASVAQVEAVIDNVVQNPSSAYTVSSNTITFTSAPLSGTNNIYVRYTSPITQVIAPGQGTVNTTALGNITNIASGNSSLTLQTGSGNTTAMTIDTSQNVGIGTSSPATKLAVNGGSINVDRAVGGGASQLLMTLGASSGGNFGQISNTGTYWALGYGSSQSTVGTQSVVWDSSGNVGIGTTSTSAKLSVSLGGVSTLGQQSNQALALLGGGSNNQLCQIGMGYGTGTTYTPTAIGSITTTQTGNTIADLIFATRSVNTDTAPTERMRINSSGLISMGTTGVANSQRLTLYGQTNQWGVGPTASTDTFSILNNGGTGVALTWGATSWSAVSDINLKNITGEISSGVNKVCSLRAAEFTWKSDETAKPQVGLIAQDVQAVLPEAVSEENGTLSVRYTEVIPLLVASIKELKALVDAQATEIAELKAKVGV